MSILYRSLFIYGNLLLFSFIISIGRFFFTLCSVSNLSDYALPLFSATFTLLFLNLIEPEPFHGFFDDEKDYCFPSLLELRSLSYCSLNLTFNRGSPLLSRLASYASLLTWIASNSSTSLYCWLLSEKPCLSASLNCFIFDWNYSNCSSRSNI